MAADKIMAAQRIEEAISQLIRLITGILGDVLVSVATGQDPLIAVTTAITSLTAVYRRG